MRIKNILLYFSGEMRIYVELAAGGYRTLYEGFDWNIPEMLLDAKIRSMSVCAEAVLNVCIENE